MPPKFPRPSIKLPGRLGRAVGQQLNTGSASGSFAEYPLEATEIVIRHQDDLTGLEEATGFIYYGKDGTQRFRMRNGVNTPTGDGSSFRITSKPSDATTTTGRTSIWLSPTYWDGSDSEQVDFILRGDLTATTPAAEFTIAVIDRGDSPQFGATLFTLRSSGELLLKDNTSGFRGITTKYKAADETISSSASLQGDDDLILVNARANEVWAFHLVVHVDNASGTPDFKYDFTGPSGATGWYSSIGQASGGNQSIGFAAALATEVSHTGSNSDFVVIIDGVFINASTAGNLLFRWAQNTSDASNTTVKAGSFAIFTRLA